MCIRDRYNIGAFTLPFVQNFLGAFGVVATCMFDTGNSIMCTGTSYTITKSVLHSEEGRLTPKVVVKRLFSSVPFDTYLIMLILVLFNIRLPEPILSLIHIYYLGTLSLRKMDDLICHPVNRFVLFPKFQIYLSRKNFLPFFVTQA